MEEVASLIAACSRVQGSNAYGYIWKNNGMKGSLGRNLYAIYDNINAAVAISNKAENEHATDDMCRVLALAPVVWT